MTPDPFFSSAGGLRPGSRFAGYVIERELGRGGAGVVFLARDEHLERLIALKVLHDDGLSDDVAAQERFRNEALLAARLEHPAIVPLYNAGTERGLTYLAMRHVSGRSLAQILDASGPMPPMDILRLLRPVAEALDYAADCGVVHRDVKPGNILVDESVEPPRAYLSDFGIARAYEGTRHTAIGSWVGTPEYIAPEVFKDEMPTGAADQYALACVLVEALTGTSPFKRTNTAATIAAHVSEVPDLTPLERFGSGTVDVFEMALSKNPADRFTSSSELIGALQQTIRADSKATPQTVVRKRRRHRRLRRALAVGLPLAAAIGFAIGAADYLGVHPFGIGANASRQSGAAIVAEDAGPPPPDVLILGTGLIEQKGTWAGDGKPTITFRDGVDAASIVTALLKRVPGTSALRTKTVPLGDAEACGEGLEELTSGGASKAIIVLESPCYGVVLQAISDMGADAPPTYVAGSGFESIPYFPSRVALVSPAMREDQRAVTPEKLNPRGVDVYLDTLPDPAEESPIVFPMVSNAEGVGSMILDGQQEDSADTPSCERLTVIGGDAKSFGDNVNQNNAAAATQLVLIRNGYTTSVDLDVYTIPRDLDRLIDSTSGLYSTKSITGQDKLDSVLKGQLVTPGMCLYIPGVVGNGMEGKIAWLAAAVERIRGWNESVPVIIEGNPQSIADPRLDVGSELESEWSRIIGTNEVWLVETYAKAATEAPIKKTFLDLLISERAIVNFHDDLQLTYWEMLPKIVAMVNAQSDCIPDTPECFGLREPGQRFEALQPGEWSTGIEKGLDPVARVDPYSRSVTGDYVFWWGSDGKRGVWMAGNQYVWVDSDID